MKLAFNKDRACRRRKSVCPTSFYRRTNWQDRSAIPYPQWLLNVDKGNQNNDGEHALRIGDVSKVVSDDFETYEIKRLDNQDQPLRMTSDSMGNLWIFVGTDSGFEGTTTLYYTSISVTIKVDA